MTGFILKIFILISFILNLTVESDEKLNNPNKNYINPYLSKVKTSKEISFEKLENLIKENNLEYKTSEEKFNQATYQLKATLK